MFYEEKVIDGRLMFRSDPHGEWQPVAMDVVTDRLMRAEAFVKHHHLAAPEEQRAVTGPDEWGSVYVYFQLARRGERGASTRTVRHEGMVNIDYDKDGKLYGIELLNVRSTMNLGGDSK